MTAYGAPYSGVPTTITGGQNQPVALAIDAQGNLYVANYGNSTVTEYAPPYAGNVVANVVERRRRAASAGALARYQRVRRSVGGSGRAHDENPVVQIDTGSASGR